MTTINKVETYLSHSYRGGLVDLDELSKACRVSEKKLIKALKEHILERCFCPESHPISKTYCEECDFNYPKEQQEIKRYFKPPELGKFEVGKTYRKFTHRGLLKVADRQMLNEEAYIVVYDAYRNIHYYKIFYDLKVGEYIYDPTLDRFEANHPVEATLNE